MSRPRKQDFLTRGLADLAGQAVRFGPPAARAEQVRRAEALHDELEPGSAYPVEYLIYRVTRFRPEQRTDEFIDADDAAADLRLLIDRLSHSAPQPADADDPMHRLDDLALRERVTPRTIDRWRQRGLRWRWWRPAPGRRGAVGVPESAWRRFAEQHAGVVARASRWTPTTPSEREAILRRAAELAPGSPPAHVARRLARETGRGVETLRQLFIDHDAEHPDRPLFPQRRTPLTPRQHRFIERARRRGVPLQAIARRLRRSPASIHAIEQQRRLARLRRRPMRYVERDGFADPEALDTILVAPLPPIEPPRRATRSTPPRVDDLPPAVAAVVSQAAPPWPTQRDLVTKMHAMRCLADRVRRGTDRPGPGAKRLDRAEAAADAADAIERRLIAVNLAAALSVVRRHLQASGEDRAEALRRGGEVAVEVLTDAIVTFDGPRSRTLEPVVRNRLLRRFAQDPLSMDKAHARPDPTAWTRELIESRGIACAWPRPRPGADA